MYFSMNNLRDMLQPRNLIIGVIAAVLLFVGMTLGGNTNSQINDYTLPEDGTYTVVVSTLAAVEGEEPQTGLFRTSISVTGANGGAPVRQTNSGSFTEEAQTFTYTFEASAGAAASVSASSTEADTYITLLAPDETVLAENDDKGSPYSFLSGISEDFYKSLGTSDTSMRLIRALFGAVVAAVLIGLMIERFSIRPLVGQPIFTLILMTLALERVFFGISLMVWGSVDKSLPVFTGLESLGIPSIIRIDAAAIIEGRITTVNIDSRLLVAFGFALLVFLAFVLFFQYTNVGLAMRATSENQVLAQSVGMRVRAILAIAWAIATLLALAAGGLYGAASNIGTSMSALAFLAFPAVLLGGLESIGGALVGGIIIGLSQTWADLLFGNDAGTQLAPYVILMIVLIIRPDGLFGQKRIERI
ncbi:MAG: branched-chain amino acid ABC transporter permease [Chloroflexota bacterium]